MVEGGSSIMLLDPLFVTKHLPINVESYVVLQNVVSE